jgi:ABC-2 type transport system permease protein
MLWRVLRHERRLLQADPALWLALGCFTAAALYGTYNGFRWTAFQRHAIAEARAEETGRIRAHEAEIARIDREKAKVSAFADPRNPDAVGRTLGARYAILPPTALAPLAIGQSDLLPSYLKMTTEAKEIVLAATELENPQRLLTGRFDLAFVLIYLYPLLILALAYNLLSAEREQGTLVLALAQPVSLRTLVVGKVVTRFALFVGAILVLAAIALAIGGIDVASPGALSRLTLWVAAVSAYGLFWFSVALAAAAAGKPSSTNATWLAGAWLVFVVLVPSVLNIVVTAMYPVPSRVEMVQAVRVASDEANEQGTKLLAKYYEDHPELASGDADQLMDDFNRVRVAVSAEVERSVGPVLQRYAQQLERQQRVVARARFASPAILMQDILNDVAGTGATRHRAFLDQVAVYHQRWRDYFVRLVFERRQLRDYSDVPQFTWIEETAGTVARRVAPGLVGLLAPAFVVGLYGLARLRRYPVVG